MARPLLNRDAEGGEPQNVKPGVGLRRFIRLKRSIVLPLVIFANSLFLFGQADDSIYRLPAGTRISVTLDAELNSKSASVNDTFLATVSKPVRVRDSVVVPIGTVIEGRVAAANPAAAASRNGELDVVFESIKLSGQLRRIEAVKVSTIKVDSSKLFSLLTVAGSIAAGAAIGSTLKISSGTGIGAAIGAGAGTSIILLKKGKDVRIKKEEEFEIELKKEVTLPVLDY